MSESHGDNVLVVCVGNDLAGDDGAGLAVFQRLRDAPLPDGVRLLPLGVGGLALLEELHGQALLVIVDAVQLDGLPGHVHVLESHRIPAATGAAVSLHGIGIVETLAVCAALYPERRPARTVLVGIEGSRFAELGTGLSAEVEAAIEGAADEVLRQIETLFHVESIA
jgi:hydrogenase maturation protease